MVRVQQWRGGRPATAAVDGRRFLLFVLFLLLFFIIIINIVLVVVVVVIARAHVAALHTHRALVDCLSASARSAAADARTRGSVAGARIARASDAAGAGGSDSGIYGWAVVGVMVVVAVMVVR